MPGRIALRRWIALPLTLVGMLLPAASAHASLNLTANPNNGRPDNTQAGAHSNFHVDFNVTGPDNLKTLRTELPPGLVGNPQSASVCTPSQLVNDSCPASSRIGEASSDVTATHALLPFPVPLSVHGDVYNVLPQGSDPATLGVVLRADALPPEIVSAEPVILIGHASARSTDFGLNTTIRGYTKQFQETDLPTQAQATLALGLIPVTLNTHIDSSSLTLFGSNPQFMTNPTSCNLATTRIVATSHEAPNVVETLSSSFTPTGCANQAYNPNLGVVIDMSRNADTIVNPDVTTEVTQGLNEANSRRVEAILPATVQANNSALNSQCASFPLDPNVPHGCGPSHQVGTAVARTPLLSRPLEGPVYLIQNPGLLPRVGLDLKGPLPARIMGNATPTADFRLDNVFGDIAPGLPDVPLSSFRLTFGGGKGGLIVATKNICDKPSQYNAIFDSFGGQHKEQTSNAKVVGCAFKKRLLKNRCNGKKLTDVGSKHRDTIRGTKKRDVINGLGGRDKIVGLKGNDLLCGGKGRDKLAGGAGKDGLFGGRGKDLLVGGKGRDKLAGGPGKDRQRQ